MTIGGCSDQELMEEISRRHLEDGHRHIEEFFCEVGEAYLLETVDDDELADLLNRRGFGAANPEYQAVVALDELDHLVDQFWRRRPGLRGVVRDSLRTMTWRLI